MQPCISSSHHCSSKVVTWAMVIYKLISLLLLVVAWDHNNKSDDDDHCDRLVTDMRLMVLRSNGDNRGRGKEVESSSDETTC